MRRTVKVPEGESLDTFRALLARAVEYFTATVPAFTEVVGERGVSLRVEADGYRRGPAGDH